VALSACLGGLSIAVNVQGSALELACRRPLLSSMHAQYSIGAMAGALLGVAAYALHVAGVVHLLVVAGVALIAGIRASRWLGPEDPSPGPSRGERGTDRRRLLVLGVAAYGAVLCEGAAADWSGVYMRDSVGVSAGLAATGYAALAITMAVGRLAGDALIARWGRCNVVRTGSALAVTGFGLSLVVPTATTSIFGFACLGAGLACMLPAIISAAGESSGISSGRAIAAVFSAGAVGLLSGPALIGGAAQVVGLHAALAVLPVAALVVGLLATRLRPGGRTMPIPDQLDKPLALRRDPAASSLRRA
jgi:Major Facilitator Superfamily